MKVKKIDIEVTEIDVPDSLPYLRVAKLGDCPLEILNENELPSPTTMHIETLEYPILKMYHPNKGYFYVAVQDKDIFETLMEFEKGRTFTLREEGRKEGHKVGWDEGYKQCLKQCKIEFKKIGWFRRLFNIL